MSVSKNFGGKLRRWERLSVSEQADFLFDLINAFTLLKSSAEAAAFVTDLLTSDEVKFLSKRLRIAKLLMTGKSYDEISQLAKTSPVTIAKVSAWLKEKGQVMKKIIGKLPARKKLKEGYDFPKSMWLGRLVENLEKESVKDEEGKLRGVLEDLGSKDVIRHREDEAYRESQRG